MENTGYIVDILKDKVKVRVDRESACGGHCVSCKGCPTEAVIAECRLIGSANIGDKVRLSMDNSKFFKKLFLGYGQTVILAVLGAIFGYIIFKTEISSVLGGFLGLLLGIIIAKLADKDTYDIVAEVI